MPVLLPETREKQKNTRFVMARFRHPDGRNNFRTFVVPDELNLRYVENGETLLSLMIRNRYYAEALEVLKSLPPEQLGHDFLFAALNHPHSQPTFNKLLAPLTVWRRSRAAADENARELAGFLQRTLAPEDFFEIQGRPLPHYIRAEQEEEERFANQQMQRQTQQQTRQPAPAAKPALHQPEFPFMDRSR